ncbi:MAG: multicopper oxidase domain-containing protein, partial [Rhizobiaceae bacterium]|nr:multicopper oxidase domain-containing protein [Rhizobiaceae bacterium]
MINRRRLLQSAGATAAAIGLPRLALAQAGDGQFELRAQPAQHALPGEPFAKSALWLYDGKLPGPEVRVRKDDTVRIKFINELDEPTSIHWHGIRISNAMDGVSGLTQDPVQPGQSFDYEFVAPDSGTYWYHAHNKSWQQVARGLYGPLIIEEPDPSFDRDHDITLMMDDWRL